MSKRALEFLVVVIGEINFVCALSKEEVTTLDLAMLMYEKLRRLS